MPKPAELGVAHPFGVGLEVAERVLDAGGRRLGQLWLQFARGGKEPLDVTGIELGEPVLGLGVLALAEHGGDQFGMSWTCSRAW